MAEAASALQRLRGDTTLGVARQIPRNSLALLMVAQVFVVVPLAQHITLWVVVVCLFCGYWRTQVYRGRWGFPPSWVKAVLVLASSIGIALSGYTTFSLEAATSLLVLAFALKLVEAKSRRDAYLVIFISYFLVSCAFLFDQTIALAVYECFALLVVTAAMVGMNQLQSRVRPLATLGTAAALLLQAVPLMLVLFLLFPRISPLWSIPMVSSATTGLSDQLTPGDIAQLSQSDELAFRVVFEGQPPQQTELYWRGLVYSDFEAGTWKVGEALPAIPQGTIASSNTVSYQVFMEPTQSRWLYSLDVPVDYGPRMSLLGDYRLLNREPVMSVFRYRLQSDTEVALAGRLSAEVRQRETQLPAGDNPRLRAWAADLWRETGSAQAMAERIMADIRNLQFAYTLSPPQLPSLNSIDTFWFETRTGFCTHYAGAMVFAMRAVGIPARLVGGYQGGEINPVTGHVVVRQYRAHSWVEVWQEGAGWVRYDPTAAVAPERVSEGLNAALSSADRSAFSFFTASRMSGEGLLNQLLVLADSLEHQWNLWVVGYDASSQSAVLRDMLGSITPTRIAIALGIGGGLSLLLVSLSLFWRRGRKAQHPLERALQSFSQRLFSVGLQRAADETPHAYITRLGQRAKVDTDALAEKIQAVMYDPDVEISLFEMQNLKAQLRRLRFRLRLAEART